MREKGRLFVTQIQICKISS